MNFDLITIGIIMLFFSIFLIVLGIFSKVTSQKVKSESGFIIWIGPFPIVGASSKEMFYFLIIASLIIFIFILILLKL